MDWLTLHKVLFTIQHSIAFVGIVIIIFGIILTAIQFIYYLVTSKLENGFKINAIRLNLGRILILGLECIVAADLIGTTTTPDYYSVGILASIVLIRTLLSFTLSREIVSLSKEVKMESK